VNVNGLDFDNYKKCTTAVTNVTYKVIGSCGTKTVTDLRGNTHEGDTVTVTFTVTSAGAVTLVTYDAPGPTFIAGDADEQSIYESVGGYYNPGTYSLTVHIPTNFYQIDFVKCSAIDHFGPEGSNIFFSAQGRLLSADNAGTHSDVDDLAASTGFWANLGQSLIKAFDVTSNDVAPTQLGNWLATNFSNLYGPSGAYNLTNKTNAQVAAMFKSFYTDQAHHKTDASIMATALNVYASTLALGGSEGDNYGFVPTADGLGAAMFNVGSNGSAFNVSNNAIVSVWQLLQTANSKSANGILYNNSSSLLAKAYNMFEAINNAGDVD